ncbi:MULTISPECIES: hypothetical protein [Bradyrhizobium]|jgi:hypothetical protein|uniref:hypothetical protein n=1 Tax=Bradyrhizobium TaxID=374 RepID=UPI0012FD28A9|nr:MULTISPECIES: hypothetical protein [Bradyrhizobium]MDI2109515.1 hypothetical protein [Bradyrhizobium sp. Mp64]WLB04506.1 hypothetical protein QNJ80_21940 [Bradyrhizobium elkanii]
MVCPPVCPREQTPRDPDSLGVIGSEESIYRGVFPSDRNKAGVKRSAIAAKQLWNGQISVWRACPLVETSLDQLVALLEPLLVRPKGEKYDHLKSVPASLIRAHQVDGERSFHLLDECEYDDHGNKHPAHAQIAICEHLKQKITESDDIFIALREGLKLLVETGHLAWQRQ